MNTPTFTTATQRGCNWVSRAFGAFLDFFGMVIRRCWVIVSSIVMLGVMAVFTVMVGLPFMVGLIVFFLVWVAAWACGRKITITSQGTPIGYWRWMTFYPNGQQEHAHDRNG